MACWSLVKDNSKKEFLHSFQNAHLWVGVKTCKADSQHCLHIQSLYCATLRFFGDFQHLSTKLRRLLQLQSLADLLVLKGMLWSNISGHSQDQQRPRTSKNKTLKAQRLSGKLPQRLLPATGIVDKNMHLAILRALSNRSRSVASFLSTCHKLRMTKSSLPSQLWGKDPQNTKTIITTEQESKCMKCMDWSNLHKNWHVHCLTSILQLPGKSTLQISCRSLLCARLRIRMCQFVPVSYWLIWIHNSTMVLVKWRPDAFMQTSCCHGKLVELHLDVKDRQSKVVHLRFVA